MTIAALSPRPAEPVGWRAADAGRDARADLQHRPFRLSHGLAHHPLFQIDALVRVAQQAAERKADLYFDAGEVGLGDKWGEIPVPDMPVDQIIRRIETAGAWIVMKHVELDPAYAAVLREFTDFVRALAGAEQGRYLLSPEMLIFITSPNRITPFHFDAEVNFLVQIQGSKDVWVCDPMDRSITTEEEIEHYYTKSITAANFKPHAEQRAGHFPLYPGDGVHIPSHAAHWVRNHNNISVSLSLNFELPPWQQSDIYRMNYYLRRIGLKPKPPGVSRLSDRGKTTMAEAARRMARLTRGKSKTSPKGS